MIHIGAGVASGLTRGEKRLREMLSWRRGAAPGRWSCAQRELRTKGAAHKGSGAGSFLRGTPRPPPPTRPLARSAAVRARLRGPPRPLEPSP